MDNLKADVNAITPEVLGVPNAEIVAKTWDRMNINYVNGNEVVDQLISFLQLFDIPSIDKAIIK